MGFFESLFGGQNTDLNKDIGATGQIASQQAGQGTKNLNTASTFWNDIVSGDATRQAQALAPAISSAKTSSNQDIKTRTEFGGRSGGATAANASTTDKVHGYITNLIGSITGQGASELGSLGTSELSTGLSAYGTNAGLSQERMQNWANSILGKGITGAVQGAEALGMGAAGGALPGGPGVAAGAQGAFASFLNG